MNSGIVFYRCALCHRVVAPWDVREGGCRHCGGTRVSPTNLSLREKVAEVVRRPRIWTWRQ